MNNITTDSKMPIKYDQLDVDIDVKIENYP